MQCQAPEKSDAVCVQLKKENVALKDEVSNMWRELENLKGERAVIGYETEQYGLGEVLSRVAALEDKFKELPAQVVPQVVQSVVKQLPQFILPAVEQSLGNTKETMVKTFESERQSMLDSVKQLKAELAAVTGPGVYTQGDLLKPSAACEKSSLPCSTARAEGDLEELLCAGHADTYPPLGRWDGRASAGPAAVKTGKLPAAVGIPTSKGPVPPGNAAVISVSAAQVAVQSGETVIIEGLQKAPELNGKLGVVVGFDSTTERYMIDMESCQGTKRIKRCNLLAMSDLGDDDSDTEYHEHIDIHGSSSSCSRSPLSGPRLH